MWKIKNRVGYKWIAFQCDYSYDYYQYYNDYDYYYYPLRGEREEMKMSQKLHR